MKKFSLIDLPHDLKRYDMWRSQWEDPNSVGFGEYVSDSCHPEDLLICIQQLLIPNFVIVDDCVLLCDRYEKNNFLQWKNKLSGENALIEKMLNHIHIYDLFGNNADDVSDSIFRQVCNAMKCSWRMALKETFPEKIFIVESFDDDVGYGPSLTFYQGS